MRRRASVQLLAVAALAAASVATADDFPAEGEALKSIDWTKVYPEGDGWKATEQVFVWNNETEPETLDPALMTGTTEHNLALCMFEGLTTHHPETLQPLPGAAEWWEISKDGLVYTFHLRKDGKWSNGEPVTAEDFRWSWERALTPATGCKYSEMFFPIKGAQRFFEWHPKRTLPDGTVEEAFDGGPAPKWSDVGVAVLDPLTLQVTLAAPTAYFLELSAFETLMPVHRATVEKHGDSWTQAGKVVSNGPFALDVWKPRDRIEFVPNPHWWNRGMVRLTRMVVRAIEDQNTSLSEYLSGGVDWIRSIPSRRVEEAQAHPDYYVAPYLGSYFFRFNVTKKPFDDVRVRKAFTMSVDKKDVCERVLKAGQIPATGVVSPGIHGYPELQGLPYDPKAARELLAEAGYPDGKGFPEVAILYNTQESHKAVCEALVDMWKQNLGVKIQLDNREWQVYLKDTRALDYQISRAGWIGDYADPNTFLDMWCRDRGNNNTGWGSDRYDALIRSAANETDAKKRFAIFQEAERMVCVEEVPILPVYYYVNQGMLRPRVKGWSENVRDLHPLQYVQLHGPSTGK
jgi:oligopeptide transport system substrate-binding protein